MKIAIPVVVGKRERLLRSVPTEIELSDGFLVLRKKFVKEEPKDRDDEYSPMEEVRYECVASLKKAHISQICYLYCMDHDVYTVEVSVGTDAAYGVYCDSRDSAAGLYSKLMDWWAK